MFELGTVYCTRGVMEKLFIDEIYEAIPRHLSGDWGEVCQEDWENNNDAVELGHRILSSYTSRLGHKFWVITEADRSSTTVLLPEEY